jgi:hypothetical protein
MIDRDHDPKETAWRIGRTAHWLLSPITPRAALRRRDPSDRIGLPSGEELREHQVHERTYLLVADGEIETSQDDNSVTGGTGFLSRLEPNERRTVHAPERLVLAPWPAGGAPLAGRAAPRPELNAPALSVAIRGRL